MSLLADMGTRFWDEIVSRPSGPLAFRFYFQPVMAAVLALRDGCKDAGDGRSPYLWAIIHDPARRSARLREGIRAVSRVLILGLVMDGIYQFIVLKGFRPLEMIAVTIVLAFIPYLILRGPAGRLARWWRGENREIHSLH
jgi:hypothetical protein